MELFLQFSHNMQSVCRELIGAWNGGTVIMSPRDCSAPGDGKPCALETYAGSFTALGGKVLVDPQFYCPDADHKNLTNHDYWPKAYDSGGFFDDAEPDCGVLLQKLGELNQRAGASQIIVPGLLASTVDDQWLDRQAKLITTAHHELGDEADLIATVALSADAGKSSEQVHRVLKAADDWHVKGVYLIGEHPDGVYLVENDEWLANLLDLIAGLRLRGIFVIVGYSNQQMLFAACSSANAIAAGIHKSKRQFASGMLMAPEEEQAMRQAPWYYCPQAYSEFKLPRLDTAHLLGVLDKMRHPIEFNVNYADSLFAGAKPSTADLQLRPLWLHYLGCLRAQALGSRKATFDDTLDSYRASLDTAENLLTELASKHIRADDRSIQPALDPIRVALDLLVQSRGAMLRRAWPTL